MRDPLLGDMTGHHWLQLAEALGELPAPPAFAVDTRGHDLWRFESELGLHDGYAGMPLAVPMMLREAPVAHVDAVIAAWRSNTPLLEPFPVLTSRYGHACSQCTVHGLVFDGFTFTATAPCQFEDGQEVLVRVPIPSGRMRVGNDFRPGFDVEQTPNINEAHGMALLIRQMAEQGVLYAFVGNSCPSVYRAGRDAFVIASLGYDEESDRDIPVPGVGEALAQVVTDLWWTSIADDEEFQRRGCTAEAHVIDVRPGVYEMRFLGLRRDFDGEYDSPTVYAEINHVGDCEG